MKANRIYLRRLRDNDFVDRDAIDSDDFRYGISLEDLTDYNCNWDRVKIGYGSHGKDYEQVNKGTLKINAINKRIEELNSNNDYNPDEYHEFVAVHSMEKDACNHIEGIDFSYVTLKKNNGKWEYYKETREATGMPCFGDGDNTFIDESRYNVFIGMEKESNISYSEAIKRASKIATKVIDE